MEEGPNPPPPPSPWTERGQKSLDWIGLILRNFVEYSYKTVFYVPKLHNNQGSVVQNPISTNPGLGLD